MTYHIYTSSINNIAKIPFPEKKRHDSCLLRPLDAINYIIWPTLFNYLI